jgi:hypothetical protein
MVMAAKPLFAFDEPVDKHVVADVDRLAVVLARQKPAWEPGTRQAYQAISLGFYEGESSRRSAAPQPGTVLPGRNRVAAWAGLLHPAP